MSASAAEQAGDRAYYVYGVVEADAAPPAGVAGVDPRFGVEVLPAGGLAVLVSAVSAEDFEGERLDESLADPAWLETRVRTHEAVLEHALERGAVVPMRFGTIHRSAESLRAQLAAEGERLSGLLARLEGKREWGVKCYVDPGALRAWALRHDEGASALRAEVQDRGEGSAFFARKQLERHVDARAEQAAEETAGESYARLAAAAAAAIATESSLAAEKPGMRLVLNAAFLVEQSLEHDFHETLAELARELEPRGFTLELTGPWPAYNFVGAEREA